MKKELKKRIITSILLFLLVIFCVFINWPIYFLFILIVSGIALLEISNLIALSISFIVPMPVDNITGIFFFAINFKNVKTIIIKF